MRIAIDQTDHARGHAGVDKAFQQRGGGGRRFFRRLAQEGTAGGQGSADLAHDLVDREIPGRERRHRAHGLLDDLLQHIAAARRHDAAIQAQRLVGKPVDDAHTGQHLALGFGQGLALFLRQHGGNGVGAFLQQQRSAAHGGLALVGAGVLPDLKAFLRGGQCTVQIGNTGMGHMADHRSRGRVVHSDLLAAGGIDPLAVDQELGIGVGMRHAKSIHG